MWLMILQRLPLLAVVLDAYVEKGRGVVAEVLVKWGRIEIGDTVVVGSTYGKVRYSYLHT
jgi:translation initiation factor IF-2